MARFRQFDIRNRAKIGGFTMKKTGISQGPWTRIRPLQRDELDGIIVHSIGHKSNRMDQSPSPADGDSTLVPTSAPLYRDCLSLDCACRHRKPATWPHYG